MRPPARSAALGAALVLALTLGAGPLWAASDARLGTVKKQIKAKGKDLAATRREMERQKRALQESEKKEGSVLGQLEALDRDMALARRELKTAQRNLGVVRNRLGDIRGLLEKDKASLAANQDALGRRLAALYKEGDLGWASFLLSSKDPTQLLDRLQFLRALARSNARMLATLREEIDRVVRFEREHALKEREILELEQKAEAERRKVAQQQARKKALLKGIRRQKQKTARTLDELRRAAEDLQSLMGSLEGEARRLAADDAASERAAREARLAAGGGSLLKSRGGNQWPVDGRLVSRYGRQKHPQFGTWVFNRGIEIAAPEGTPFHAVAPGRVIYAGWFTGFGQMAVVDHGGGYYSLYAQASDLSVEKGQRVETGESLGEVGDSGSLAGPALYFEVRKNGKAIDPLSWLRSRSRTKQRRSS